MTESIEAALLAGQQAIQGQLSSLERTTGETAQAVRGIVKDTENWGKRVEKLELQVGGLLSRETADDSAARTRIEVRARDKGIVFAALTALAIIAAMARDIVAAIRSAL